MTFHDTAGSNHLEHSRCCYAANHAGYQNGIGEKVLSGKCYRMELSPANPYQERLSMKEA